LKIIWLDLATDLFLKLSPTLNFNSSACLLTPTSLHSDAWWTWTRIGCLMCCGEHGCHLCGKDPYHELWQGYLPLNACSLQHQSHSYELKHAGQILNLYEFVVFYFSLLS
ncbi:hypothetical protein K443DRAFT_675217, partial [Laccaria amethystina LaAM-08-1]